MPNHTTEREHGRVLTITHSAQNGTTLKGTTGSDDLYGALRGQGWNYRPSIPDFRLQGSPNAPAKRYAIDRTAEFLRGRGFDVEITIDDTARSFDATEADLAANADQRASRHRRRSTSLATAAEAKHAAARRVLDHIPPGQPYLADHYSYSSDRRSRERAWKNQDEAAELARRSARIADLAETASNFTAYRNNPETVIDRIRELEAQQRAIARAIAHADEIDALHADADEARRTELTDRYGLRPMSAEDRVHLAARTAWLAEQLRGWRQVREQQITDGLATNYSKDTIAVGDLVARRNGDWFPVLRVNTVSVTVPSPSGNSTGTIRFEHLSDHVRPADDRWATAKTAAITTGTRFAGARGPHRSITTLMAAD